MTDRNQQPDPLDTNVLDRLVQQALDDEPDQVTLARLQRFWRHESAKTPPARWRAPLVAAAAALAVAVGLSTPRRPQAPDQANQIVPEEILTNPVEEEVIHPVTVPPDTFASRPPTPFERVAFIAMTSHRKPRSIAPAEQPAAVEDQVAQLLSHTPPAGPRDLIAIGAGKEAYGVLLSQPDNEQALRLYLEAMTIESQREAALAALREAKSPPIDGLLALLQDDDRATRRLAALALGTRNGPEVTRRLIAIVSQQNPRNAEAWLALDTCRGDLAHSFLAEASRQPKLLGYFNAARVRWSLPL